jgi:DnaJ-class molecular chaperone
VGVPNYYELLEVDPEAEVGVIEEAFQIQSARYHPTNEATGNPYLFHQVAEAWCNLKRTTSRERYDRLLKKSRKEAESSGD